MGGVASQHRVFQKATTQPTIEPACVLAVCADSRTIELKSTPFQCAPDTTHDIEAGILSGLLCGCLSGTVERRLEAGHSEVVIERSIFIHNKTFHIRTWLKAQSLCINQDITMGTSYSKDEIEREKIKTDAMRILQSHLSKFLEIHCESSSNGYLMYNDLIAHFYTYLKHQNILITIQELNECMFDLLKTMEVRREGVSFGIRQGHHKTLSFHNYSYIYGLKLTKPLSCLSPPP
jgi:hypothetical protein